MNNKGSLGWIVFVVILMLAVAGIFYSIGTTRSKTIVQNQTEVQYVNQTCEDYKDLIINQDTSYITNAIANVSQRAYQNGKDSVHCGGSCPSCQSGEISCPICSTPDYNQIANQEQKEALIKPCYGQNPIGLCKAVDCNFDGEINVGDLGMIASENC